MDTAINIVVDYGNSSAKVGLFDDDKLTAQYNFPTADELKNFLENFSAVNLIISSVTKDPVEVSGWAARVKRRFVLNPDLPLPVNIKYATPTTLGVDRIAGVCGAQHMFPKINSLVIDTGTCITYDFLDKDSNFLGGGISPGLMMRFNAVHNLTARLPLVGSVEDPPLIGNSTESCIQSGVINGLIEELNGIISLYKQKFEGLEVILTGGDSRFFENKLKGSIFAVPELVLSGLNSILIHNVGR